MHHLYSSFLILFSSFSKDVTLPPSLKLVGMTDTKAVMSEIVVTGFGDTQTAYLARAALARLQKELGMATEDVAMVLRGVDGDVAVQQTLNRDTGRSELSTFWKTLVDQLFAPKLSAGTATEAASGQRTTIGIDPTITSRAANQLRLCESALLVRTSGLAQREKVVGLLQGFDGELARLPLEP